VVVFGSLNHPEGFDSRSDIDLVVRGVPPARFYRAVADVTAVSTEFEVDLIDGDARPAGLRDRLESEAVTL
jgi:predicted nucleotidyltransferase